jgi:hypothetical protein
MKKKLSAVLAFVLILAIAFPNAAFADPIDDIPHRVEGDVVFVPLRQMAEAYGWTVVWERETGIVYLICPMGMLEYYYLDELVEATGGFIERGVTWIPLFIAINAFATLPMPTVTLELTEEAVAIALEDFDYMVGFVLENTPWDSVIGRMTGLGFEDFVNFYRGLIEERVPLTFTVLDEELLRAQIPYHGGDTPREVAANYLFMLLNFFAGELMGVGHLMPRTLDVYTAQYTGFIRGRHDEETSDEMKAYSELVFGAFSHPSAIWFYGKVEVDLDAEDSPFPQVPGNVFTSILVPGEVAFIRINTFLSDTEYDDAYILPFLQEVSGFDHLIIDIRENGGGLIYYPLELLFARLINESVYIDDYEFFAGGEAALALMEAAMQMVEDMNDVVHAEIVYAGDFITERGMEWFHEGDLERLDYVIVSRSLRHPADDAVGFEGQVWLLVDGFSASTSALFAMIAMETGFATVVGDNTSHIMGSTHMYIALPNTGIVWRTDIGYRTDAYGRSLEVYGIAPDIRNYGFLCALETVLAIIFE